MRSECKNCGHVLHANDRYCVSCGQKAAVHRLTFHALSHEVVHYVTHIERNIFTLIARLASRPGVVVKEYISGKRKKYFPPVSFFLVVAGLLVISISVAHTFNLAFAPVSDTGSDTNVFQHFVTSKINWIFFLLTLLYPLIYRLLYYRKTYNYVEHLVASFYWQGFLLLFFIVFLIPYVYVSNSLGALYTAFWIYMIVQCMYYAGGYYQLFPKKGLLVFLMNFLLSVVTNLLVFFFCVLIIRLYYVVTHK